MHKLYNTEPNEMRLYTLFYCKLYKIKATILQSTRLVMQLVNFVSQMKF